MLKQGSKIDESGFFIEEVIYDDSKEIDKDIIVVERPQGLYKAKWDGNKWIETVTVSLDTFKRIKVNELSLACNNAIINSFYSDADGTKKLYDFELENQVNLSIKAYQIQIAKLAGQSIGNISYYAKGETCHDYTAEQLLKLAQDGENWKTANIVKYKDKLKPMVLACTTVDEVNAIAWESDISATQTTI